MKLQAAPFSVTKNLSNVLAIFCASSSINDLLSKSPKEHGTPLSLLNKSLKNLISKEIKRKEFKAKAENSLIISTPFEKRFQSILIYCGDESNLEHLRLCGAHVQRFCEKEKHESVSISGLTSPEAMNAIVEGISLTSYSFTQLKSKSKKNFKIKSLTFLGVSSLPQSLFKKTNIVTGSICKARDIANLPANLCKPKTIVDEARAIANARSLDFTVFNKKSLEKIGAGALLAVAKGSVEEPFLIKLSYSPVKKSSDKKIALVGKGITYDTGGYSLKPAGSMDGMKFDMCGAAAVLYTMEVLAQLKPTVEVTAYIPTCENMVNGEATRPGDVVTSLSGKTIEILNTDAEGRLILADALTMAVKDGATEIVDIGTLTGGILVALGAEVAGIFSNNDELARKITEASHSTGEDVWRLPLIKKYDSQTRGAVADLKNISSSRNASSIMCALFLEHFVDNKPWVHMDIAGVADADSASGYTPKGATGFGIRTLVEYVLGS